MDVFPYIDKSIENVRNVDPREISDLYQELREVDGIILSGEGRSYSALKIGGSELAKSMPEFRVYTPEDTGFPGDTPEEFMPDLKERHDKLGWIFNSGSGESVVPVTNAEGVAEYMDENDVENCSLHAVTSNPDSTIGRIAQDYGVSVKLSGRKEEQEEVDYSEGGTMGDVFELGSLLVYQSLVEWLHDDYDDFFKIVEEKKSEIYDDFESINEEALERIIKKISQRSNVRFDGKGSSREVGEMAAIRTQHVEALPYAGGDSQVRGGAERRHKEGDLLIAISSSGDTPYIVESSKYWKEKGGEVIAFTGTPGSPITKIADDSVELESERRDSGPDDFYLRAAYAYSQIPNMVLNRFEEKGYDVSERILRDIHV